MCFHKQIKVLMVLGSTERGGVQAYVMNVIRNIDHQQYHIDFAVNYIYENDYTEEIRQYGSNIFLFPKFIGLNYIEYVNSFNRILDNGNYDIVHGHVSSTASIYLGLAKKHGCITIAHSHSAGYRGNVIIQYIKKIFTIAARKQADYWFGCSALAATRMFGVEYKNNPKYFSIPNAIITEHFFFNNEVRERIRKQFSIPNNAILYGHVGSFTPPKNHRFLIKIFERIVEDQGNEAFLLLVGDGILKKEVEKEVRAKKLSGQVIFTGNVDNVNEILMAMDVLIFPSLFEGFPVAVLEAQSSGLYCVISDSITAEVCITDYIVSLSLSASIAEWALIAEKKTSN